MKKKAEIKLAKRLFSDIDNYQIATHQRLDADAAFSTALILSLQKDPQPVIFVDSVDPINNDDCIGLDLDFGGSSIKGDSVGSCFGLLVEVMEKSYPGYYKYLRTIADHMNRTDSGKSDFHSYLDPHYLIRWWRLASLTDTEIIHNVYLLFKGIRIALEKEEGARAYLNKHGRKEKFCMIVENPPKDSKIHKFVFRNGIDVYIYYNTRPEDMGMGVIINSKFLETGFSCHHLKNKLPKGWVIKDHMAFWGSLKFPQDPSQSGISLNEFVERVNKQVKAFLKSKKRKKINLQT